MLQEASFNTDCNAELLTYDWSTETRPMENIQLLKEVPIIGQFTVPFFSEELIFRRQSQETWVHYKSVSVICCQHLSEGSSEKNFPRVTKGSCLSIRGVKSLDYTLLASSKYGHHDHIWRPDWRNSGIMKFTFVPCVKGQG